MLPGYHLKQLIHQKKSSQFLRIFHMKELNNNNKQHFLKSKFQLLLLLSFRIIYLDEKERKTTIIQAFENKTMIAITCELNESEKQAVFV